MKKKAEIEIFFYVLLSIKFHRKFNALTKEKNKEAFKKITFIKSLLCFDI